MTNTTAAQFTTRKIDRNTVECLSNDGRRMARVYRSEDGTHVVFDLYTVTGSFSAFTARRTIACTLSEAHEFVGEMLAA